MTASGSPIQIESDDCGIRVVIELDLLDDVNTLGTQFVPDGEGVIRGRLSGDAALALYEHVERELGEWAREGIAARRAVSSGVSREQYLGLGAPTADDGDEWADEAMRDEADRRRKAERENG